MSPEEIVIQLFNKPKIYSRISITLREEWTRQLASYVIYPAIDPKYPIAGGIGVGLKK